MPDGSSHAFDMEPFAKECLLRGMDEIDYTLSHRDRIDAFERNRAGHLLKARAFLKSTKEKYR